MMVEVGHEAAYLDAFGRVERPGGGNTELVIESVLLLAGVRP